MNDEGFKTLVSLAEFEGTDPFEFISSARCGSRKMPVFKVLFTNFCEKNCLYCANRRDRDVKRFSFTPEGLAKTFYELYTKGYVEGIFISSGIHHNSLRTMEKILDAAEILRKKYKYTGFMHLKLLPGVDTPSIERAVELADRVSINLEAPSHQRLLGIAGEKKFGGLFNVLKNAHETRSKKEKRTGLCTQFVVGASGESDFEILKTTFLLRRAFQLQRVYYSAFYPVPQTPLENLKRGSKRREFRLYQAFYLIKNYGVKPEDFLFENGFLKEETDPKEGIFKKIFGDRLIEVNRAPLEILVLIPGIGIKTAKRIVEIRRESKIKSVDQLLKTGANKKSLKYILIDGKNYAMNSLF
jgi:predicted DNA-binding helix-hairpin-helix protein